MEWISVEERLPEIKQWVLVYMNDAVMSHCDYAVTEYDKYGFNRSRVTHWMPLPAPPTTPKKIKVGSILKCINKRELLSKDISILKNADCEFEVYAFIDNDILLECMYGFIRIESNELDNMFSLID